MAPNVSGSEINIQIEYLPGTEVIVERQPSRPGDSSHFLKLIDIQLDGNFFRIVVEGRGGQAYQLRIRSHKPILKATNAEIAKTENGETGLRFAVPQSERDSFVRRIIALETGQAIRR